MKLLSSWLKINRTLTVVLGITALFVALLASGKTPLKSTAPKIMAMSLPKIALVAADNPSFVSEVQGKLIATGRFSQVDIIGASSTTPTVNQLRAYKSVLVWSDSGFANATALGNNLADYVDGGGGVVIAVFTDAIVPLSGRFVSDDYYVLEPTSDAIGGQLTLGTIYEPSSPLMAGVTSFDGGSSSFRDGTPILNANAVRVADWSDGEPLIARRTINGNRRVDLNFFPPSSDSQNGFWVSSTDGVKIMANALEFVGLASCDSAPAGMVSWWKAEGNANDSQDSNNGTVQSGVTFATGEVGQAFSFDGSGGVLVPDANNLDVTTQFTLDAWVNAADLSSLPLVFSKFVGGNGSYELELYDDGSVRSNVSGDGTSYDSLFSGPGVVTTGSWYHVATTFNGGDWKIYVNGVQVASKTSTVTSIFAGTADLFIGRDVGTTHIMNGLIDEAEIFNRALSAIEVARLYNAGSLGKCPCTPAPDGMISWWKAENDYVDSADGNHGTQNGSVPFAPGEVGQAFSFNGDPNNYVSIGNPSNLKPTGGITLDAWINLNNVDGDGRAGIITKWGQGAEDNWAIWALQGEGGIVLDSYVVTTSGQSNASGGSIPIGVWTHVALTYDAASGTQTVYVNGVSVGTTSLPPSSTLIQTNADVCIGRECTSNPRPFNGLIDEVEVFDRALSASEIAALYTAGGAGKCRTCTSAPSGMINWWKAEGNASDSQDSRDGTPQGGTTFAPGEVGQAFNFDGSTGYIDLGAQNLLGGFTQVTIDAWVYPAPFESYEGIIYPGPTNIWWIQLTPAAQVRFAINNAASGSADSTNTIPANQWTHLALTWDGETARLYINGVQDPTTLATSGAIPDDSGNTKAIGSRGGIDQFFNGLIDEVEIFTRALSIEEIQNIYAAGSYGKCHSCDSALSGLVGWWPGDGNTKDIASGNNGLLKNGATFATAEVGKGFSLDGTDDYVEIADNPDVSVTGPITIDAWIKTNDTGPEHAIVEKYDNPGLNGYFLRLNPGGHLRAGICSAGGVTGDLTGGTQVSTGTFHHVAAVYDGTNLQVYLDGILDAGPSSSGAPTDGTAPL